MPRPAGLYAMMVTPFDEAGEVGHASIPTLCDFYLDRGASGLVALGLMGEAHRLTAEEAVGVAEAVLGAVEGRAPVIVGVSASAPRASLELAATVMAAGAAGVMLAPLPNQRDEAQSAAYLEAMIAQLGPDVPVVIQDYPQETGSYLSAPILARLIEANPSICALKHEDVPGLGKLAYLRSAERGPRIAACAVLAGGGGLYLPLELGRGADGAMTGFAFPEVIARVCTLHAGGRAEAAEDLFDLYLPYLRYEQQPRFGLAVRKHVLQRRGAIASAGARWPAPSLTADDLAEIERFMRRLERAAALSPEEG